MPANDWNKRTGSWGFPITFPVNWKPFQPMVKSEGDRCRSAATDPAGDGSQ